MSKIKDLFNGETPEGYVLQSWLDGNFVYVTFGYVTVVIPESEFYSFAEYIGNSAMKKRAIDELESASKKKRS